MRLAVLLCLGLIAVRPAAAQGACEASVTGKAGEVIATIDDGRKLVSWAVEPTEGVGVEAPHFSRPGLLIDFAPRPDGALAVTGVIAIVTRISDRERGQAPALSAVKLRARAGGAPIEWAADSPHRGEAELTRQLKTRWPETLTLDALVNGEIVASAEFPLSSLPVVQQMAREAMGKCAS